MKATTAIVIVAVAGSAAVIAYSISKMGNPLCMIIPWPFCLWMDDNWEIIVDVEPPITPAPMTLGV